MKILFNPEINKAYLDMDGVLADFDGFVLENIGRVFINENGPDENDDEMWKFLCSTPHMYLQLKPTSYAFELVETVQSLVPNVEILTAIPRRHHLPEAQQDKIDWTLKYFGPSLKVNFGPYSADKWHHAKQGDILIDDRASNIREWINHGMGFGILHNYHDHRPTIETLKSILS